jgi:transcriptional regulator with XRE-family HTH domain
VSFTYDPEKTWQNEPDPEMDSMNPFVDARNHNGWHQADIAGAMKIAAIKVMRLEQGVIDVPAKEIVAWYQKNLELPRDWEVKYRTFRFAMRRSAPRPILGGPPIIPRGEINFRRWRAINWPGLSQVHWAKAFCVHPADVWRMEQPNWEGLIPNQVIEALKEAKIFDEDQAEQFRRTMRTARFGVGR